ncbi:hypothetical protein LTS08_000887 [Lithohypha guttulata]|uniref:uncharacterized protein n=1 Tax=Lithohypha guttulata TaxID=1690604 RepID=UPI002DE0B5CF|nr:hypothetical protein LTR51_006498 [Lithohypha guttulata]KAK5106765.1 hypothetical protein LTS08_000887 [Lithohypha guttulata]
MTELHDALKYLGPAKWSDIPQDGPELDGYLTDLHKMAQLIVDSLPAPVLDSAPPQSQGPRRATKASEVRLSSEIPPQPPFGHEKFQKEWGKPMKMKPQENPLGLSVYKMSSKDSKGSWFARRSIHEGIGFSQFKKSLQIEFEKSLAEQGPPGTGNVRGIGGEERVEQIKTDKATVEVYRLSAQFPGPTAARDFVTLLVTSDHALKTDAGKERPPPRHYMIISRPCDHPKTQPRTGFVRGYYESIEFIREVPRKLKVSQSSIDLGSQSHHHKHQQTGHPRTSTHPISPSTHGDHGRKRSMTTDDMGKGAANYPDPGNPEDDPVEWVMVTRSDPGGGIPRFLVERGTPGSICSDAVKFIDWACQNDQDMEQFGGASGPESRPLAGRKQSHQSWRGRGLVGVAEEEQGNESTEAFPRYDESQESPANTAQPAEGDQAQSQGIFSAVKSYTPQVILDRLPAAMNPQETTTSDDRNEPSGGLTAATPDDARSVSGTSFVSAEEHWSSEPESDDGEAGSIESGQSATAITGSKEHIQHEKELRRLDERKQALHNKFAETQTKYDEARTKQQQGNAQQHAKTSEKHDKEMKKHKEKYEKEVAKVERKQEKQRKKHLEKAKKTADKDKEQKLTRERDEARKELDLLKKEATSLRKIVQELQQENTNLVIRLGKAGLSPNEAKEASRSRNTSLSRKDKKNIGDPTSKDLAIASAAASLKSSESRSS